MAELNSKGIPFSIFDENRQEDFNSLWVANVPVVYDWGVSACLKPLALKAIAACNSSNPYGILKANTDWAYFHPLLQVHSKQQKWVDTIKSQLTI